MKAKNFMRAVDICSKNHSTKVLINYVASGDTVRAGENNKTLHIIDCCASVVQNLFNDGFSLSLHKGMMSVDDYAL